MPLDLIPYPVDDSARPTIMVLPGGGYQHLADHEGEPVAHWLNSLGLHAAVLRYALGEDAHPQALVDGRNGLRALRSGRAGLAVERDRLGVLGFSAGGHLAAMLATDSPDVMGAPSLSYAGRPDAAILCYPVTDLREALDGRIPNLHRGSARTLLGEDASAELLLDLSPAARVDEDIPPCFFWTTSDDEGVPALHSLEMMTALAVAGIPFEAHVFRHGRHGLGLATEEEPAVAQWQRLCATWLAGLGWNPPA
ncbi:alpha/beta hydrolase [Microlunatus sp. Gsoil 973]|uniref:alpha/beta hydrolase n=1 Tax=Microlunatus sp. Gsoil 973 TaxID=2672569 RepID=UPI0012B4B848|nr:alpha/beta hydrolase [Microlunatus sp. Gsoil 973]QGN34029.1 prolyl oligopeptidase family serine peptidase [Microlunatus sp. Gsoil 973]